MYACECVASMEGEVLMDLHPLLAHLQEQQKFPGEKTAERTSEQPTLLQHVCS